MATQSQRSGTYTKPMAQVADTVTSSATQVTDTAKETLRQQADARLDGVAQQMGTVSEVLHQGAENLRAKQQPLIAGQADRLAARADAIAQHLRESSAQSLLMEAEDYARSRPAVVLGAAAIAGFAIARLLKAGTQAGAQPEPGMGTEVPMPQPIRPAQSPATPYVERAW